MRRPCLNVADNAAQRRLDAVKICLFNIEEPMDESVT